MRPYYEDENVTLYHGDCLEVMEGMPSVDHVITDPPYSSATHSGARTRTTGARSESLVTFTEWTDGDMENAFREFGRIVGGWVIATMDWRHIAQLAENTPPGLLSLIHI